MPLSHHPLSGNVVVKLRDARAWVERDSSFDRNVAALEAVQPVLLGPRDIIVNLNAFWLPDEVVSTFITTLLPTWTGSAYYNTSLGEWKLSDPGHLGADAVEATTRWGTTRADAISILQASLRGVPITVYDVITVGDQEKRVFNPTETVAAQEKQQAIKAAFARWVWEDSARADALCRRYNDRFNTVRMRSYDGSHLSFPGINTTLLRGGDLADYQKSAVWQILQCQSALLGFAVGGGKTFTAIAGAVEARRLGLCAKALAVVPKNLVGQWASEARRLYPGIRVLAMAPEEFTRQRRSVVLSRIATGDWDLVVIAHTSFKLLPLSAELVTSFRDAETDRLRAYLEEQHATATSSDEKRSLKQIERAIKKLDERLQRMLDGIARDSARTITWDELGLDMLIVDEFHEFKNLGVPTRLTNIAGLPSANSQRALDMRIKTWDLRKRHKKLVALTATPIMNSIGEAYVMQVFLQEQQLEKAGIHHFDEWVSLYAQPKMAFEMKPDGSGFRMHTRLAAFVNLPEMSAMWRQVLNLRTKAQMSLPEPALVTRKLIPVVVPPSAALKRFVDSLAARAEAVRNGDVEPTRDNLLKIVSDGRKAALDIRLVVPNAPRPRQSKIAALVATVAQLHHTYTPLRGTQLVFCDLATPKGAGRGGDEPVTRLSAAELEVNDADDADEAPQELETVEERWLSNFVYYEIRDGLVALGVPRNEIVFIHEVTTKAQRDALFAAVNAGRVRVLIGSTAKMSVGMNVQQRLIALHDLDCPWRPGDLEQRHGRMLRQGNQWPEAYLFAYITERSFDAFMWQTVESKARFIEQALVGEITARTIEDTSDVVLSAAEIKAIASGNPQVMRKVQLEVEVARLERVRAVWRDTRRSLQFGRHVAEEEIRRLDERRATWVQAEAIIAAHPRELFHVEVAAGMNSAVFIAVTDRGEAGAAVWKLLNEYKGAAAFLRRRLQGEAARYRGLSLTATAHELFGVELSLTLPDRTTLAGVATNTDSGVWQSAGHAIGSIAETLQSLRRRCDELRERIATTDGELERLRAWDGQPAYDDALIELQVINAAFAAAEEQDKAARVGASIPAGEGTAAEVTAQTASTDEAGALATELLTLARTEGTGSGWDEWRPLIPLAPASLTWMAAELERQTASSALIAQPATDVHTDAGEVPQTSGAGELVRLHSKARVAFGDRVPRRHAQKPALPPHVECEREASQLALF